MRRTICLPLCQRVTRWHKKKQQETNSNANEIAVDNANVFPKRIGKSIVAQNHVPQRDKTNHRNITNIFSPFSFFSVVATVCLWQRSRFQDQKDLPLFQKVNKKVLCFLSPRLAPGKTMKEEEKRTQ